MQGSAVESKDARVSATKAAVEMDAHVRAGVAVYNAGYHHAAHDAWEARWLDLESGSDDERFLHGLIQFTAAVHHAHGGNWTGVQGLAASAGDYLADLPAEYRGVDVAGARDALAAMAADPVSVERAGTPPLRYEGDVPGLESLDVDAALVAAPVLAEGRGDDEALLETAVGYAREDLSTGESGPFVGLVVDYVTGDGPRELVLDRLRRHADRRRSRAEDVAGLFEDRD